MAGKRRDRPASAEEQTRKAEAQASILLKPSVTVVDMATGDTESVWIWELED